MNEPWSPDSWRRYPAAQQPEYPDAAALEGALSRLAQLPPLVTSWEIERLKGQLAAAARGEQFLLQGGDCCERFEECASETIVGKLKILLQMGLILIHGGHLRVIRVGRLGGQYAKPRSTPTETRESVALPVYRGDLINGPEFTPEARAADPERLVRGYGKAALTLNFIRALGSGGFADLHQPHQWDLGFASHSVFEERYHGTVHQILQAIHFLETIVGGPIGELNQAEFYTSHEGLLLCYEQAQTRRVPRRTGWYNLTTHYPWIGDRTRALNGAHVEYFRGIANPIGVKVGPGCGPEELLALVARLDPEGEPGRLTVIHRFGAARIAACLPPLVEAMTRAGRQVLWCCDPMHGNTEVTENGYKTRRFDNVLHELDGAFAIHRELGSRLGGVHFELTGEDVTECLGGARGLASADLGRAYRSQVDPRLNYEQALETALLIAERIGR
ncbi:MAG: 3-deoxy-7-phosphoheptulonate synthase class II [Candidatus Latescibacterota bacterium]|jgi:3-deoxy-7-phosphoheptulonate synthase